MVAGAAAMPASRQLGGFPVWPHNKVIRPRGHPKQLELSHVKHTKRTVSSTHFVAIHYGAVYIQQMLFGNNYLGLLNFV